MDAAPASVLVSRWIEAKPGLCDVIVDPAGHQTTEGVVLEKRRNPAAWLVGQVRSTPRDDFLAPYLAGEVNRDFRGQPSSSPDPTFSPRRPILGRRTASEASGFSRLTRNPAGDTREAYCPIVGQVR